MTDEVEEEEGVKGKRGRLPIVLGVLAVLLVIATACGKNVYDGCPKKADGSLDCSDQDLSGERLRELDFSGADFSGANLRGAAFNKADLRNANLSGLDLSEEDMFNFADLSGANLSGANLSGADLRNVNFSGANLKGANLAGVDLSGLDLSKSDLTGADLKGVTADTDTRWPEGFDSKVAGVTVTTTTTIQPLPPGFKLPPGDVIDRTATLHDHGRNEIHVKVRNSGTKHAYYCIDMRYEFPDDWEYLTEENWLLDQEGFGESIRLTYGTDYSIPPDGQERVLALERRPDWYGKMFYEYYTGGWTHYIVKFEKLSSPCK